MSKLFIATLFIFMMNKSHAVTITINDQNQQPLANAVVWLTATDNTLQALPTDSPFTMTQKQRQFTPHILVVPQNAQVEFPNADSIMHHVYSFSSAKSFELKLYREQPQAPSALSKLGSLN